MLVLAVLRHDQRAADLDGGNQVSATTIRRWTDEVIALLAAKAPCLDRALKKIARRGAASEVKTARHDKLCAPPAWAPWRTSASLAWTTTPTTPVVITGVKRTRKEKLTAGQK